MSPEAKSAALGSLVMAGFVPGIHVGTRRGDGREVETWMAGTSPAMTARADADMTASRALSGAVRLGSM